MTDAERAYQKVLTGLRERRAPKPEASSFHPLVFMAGVCAGSLLTTLIWIAVGG